MRKYIVIPHTDNFLWYTLQLVNLAVGQAKGQITLSMLCKDYVRYILYWRDTDIPMYVRRKKTEIENATTQLPYIVQWWSGSI